MHVLYTITGDVKHGAKNGTAFGFPTANVSLSSHIPEGVYAAEVIINGKTYMAATFIGSAPTFGDAEYKSESYILDFSKKIYGETITIKLCKKIRGRMSFINEQYLIKQMENDVKDVREFFQRT